MSNDAFSVGSSTLGMYDALWDALASKVSKLVDQREVLQDDRSLGASGHRVLVVVDRGAVRSSQRLSAVLFHLVNNYKIRSAAFN